MDDKIIGGILIGLVFVILIISFCVILIRLYFTKIKKYTALIYQKDLDFQKTLTAAIIETQEQVLQNIARDLHDDAGQQLTSLNFQIESLRLDSARYNAELEPLSQSVKQLSASVRNLSHSLSNQLLVGDDLIKAIEAETERLKNTGRLKVQFTLADKGSKFFSADEKIVLFRIFQESIGNILKHSGAAFVSIEITTVPFAMVIRDDGKGFEGAAGENPKRGLGIVNMANRAAFINHTFAIDSIPGTGTTIKISQNKS